MTMMVCLSQAPQNGWETWFSLQYGTGLANLCTNIDKIQPKSIKTALKEAQQASAEAAKKADPNLPQTKNTGLYKILDQEAKWKL